VNTINNLEYG